MSDMRKMANEYRQREQMLQTYIDKHRDELSAEELDNLTNGVAYQRTQAELCEKLIDSE